MHTRSNYTKWGLTKYNLENDKIELANNSMDVKTAFRTCQEEKEVDILGKYSNLYL